MGRKTLNFIDLFAGAGGFSCGLEMAGLNCLLGVDQDKYAMQTFAANHNMANTYCGDIAKLSTQELLELINHKKVDIVVGGPPCQGFSTVGRGNPNDIRNKLFMEFVRIVKDLRPEFIVIENVTGLVAKKNEKILAKIFSRFQKLGYTLDAKVLAAHDYGTPEKRKRTIIIGSRINSEIIFPRPSHGTDTKPFATVGDAFKNLRPAKGKKILNHDIDSAQVKSDIDFKRLSRVPEGKGIRYQKDEDAYFTKSLKLGINWNEIPENRFRQTKYQRLNRKEPGPTIMTHRHNYFHPKETRYLTQREAAAIQSFPNDFEFKGPLSAQWRQIGNAVPPLLAKNIAESIKKMYNKAKKENGNESKRVSKKKIKEIRSGAFSY